MFDTHAALIVLVAALVTAATRFLPFLIFGSSTKTPAFISELGKFLPCAIIGMLVVYCLKDAAFLEYPYAIPEILGCIVVAALHVWKRNSLLSIGVGTVFYMVLIQLVFK